MHAKIVACQLRCCNDNCIFTRKVALCLKMFPCPSFSICTTATIVELKTYLRSTISQQRLNGLALLNVHRDINLSVYEIIDRFAITRPRKMKLIDILNDPIDEEI